MNNENENTNLFNFEGGGTKSVPNKGFLGLILLEV